MHKHYVRPRGKTRALLSITCYTRHSTRSVMRSRTSGPRSAYNFTTFLLQSPIAVLYYRETSFRIFDLPLRYLTPLGNVLDFPSVSSPVASSSTCRDLFTNPFSLTSATDWSLARHDRRRYTGYVQGASSRRINNRTTITRD